MMGSDLFLAVSFVLANVCSAAEIAVPQLPPPQTVGTEVSTNIPVASARSDVREMEIGMQFSGTASNCVQMAFGLDADADGMLAPEETAFVLGWRGGRYFIEESSAGLRLEEVAPPPLGNGRALVLNVAHGRDSSVKFAMVRDESNRALFAETLAACPGWLSGTDWDLCRVMRRGVDAPLEFCRVMRGYGFFHVFLK